MKKFLLFAGFLIGCAPGLTTTRVEGLATYTTAINKLTEVEKRIKRFDDGGLAQTSGWKQIYGTNSLALLELKSAIAHNDNSALDEALKEAKSAEVLMEPVHLEAIFRVYQVNNIFIPGVEAEYKIYNIQNNSAWIAARNYLKSVAKQLADAAVTTNSVSIEDRTEDLNKALVSARQVITNLVDSTKALPLSENQNKK